MIISGIQKTSLIDYPGKICTVLFTRGCNFYCGFCHNPELVIAKKYKSILNTKDILGFLNKRKNITEAVTITGGEPTLHKDLPDFIRQIKKYGYFIKLDTNGTNPKMLNSIINQKIIDYVAMDIKNSFDKYSKTADKKVNIKNIKNSIKLIINSDINYEFRTTVLPNLHTKKDFIYIAKTLKNANLYILQKFRPGKTINPNFSNLTPPSNKDLKRYQQICQKYISKVIIR